MKKLKLGPGEYKCKLCKGKGKIPAEKNPECIIGIVGQLTTCPECQGTGKLDWIENVIGKKKPVMFQFGTDSSASVSCQHEIDSKIIEEIAGKLANTIDDEILKMVGVYNGKKEKEEPLTFETFSKKVGDVMRQMRGNWVPSENNPM